MIIRVLAPFWLLLLWFLLPAVALAEDAEDGSKKILLLYSYGHGSRGVDIFDEGMLDTLYAGGYKVTDLFFEYLDTERFKSDPTHIPELIRELERKYPKGTIDLVFTGQQPARQFLLTHGGKIAPGAPVVTFQAPPPAEADALSAGRRFYCLLAKFDIHGTVKSALSIFPKAKKFIVVVGDSEADRKMAETVERAVEPWKSQIEFDYTTGAAYEDVLTKVSSAGKDTLVLFTQFNRDAKGRATVAYEVEAAVVKAASTPVFGLYDFNLRNRGIGGSVVSVHGLGVQSANLMDDILDGRRTSDNLVNTIEISPVPMFDWGQIIKWRGLAGDLPQETVFVNKEPTLWERYHWHISAAIALMVIEAALIALLVSIRRRKEKVELRLRSSEERFRQLAENIDEVFWISSPDKRTILYVSPAFEKIWGITPQELYANPLRWLDLIHPDDRARVRQRATTKQETGEYHEEYRLVRSDGEIRWISDRAFPLKNEAGAIYRIVGIASDITLMKNSEQALRQNEEFYRNIINGAMDGFWLLDDSARIVQVNKAYCSMSGYSESELVGRTPGDLDVLITAEEFQHRARVVVERGWDRFLTKQRTRDGRLIDVEGSTQYLPIDGGRFVVFLRDITDRVRSLEELKESELKLRTIFENSRDAIGVSARGIHLYANPSYLKMFGLKELSGIEGLRVLDLIAEEEHAKIADYLLRRARGIPAPASYETKGRRLDGTVFDMEAMVSTYELNGELHTLVILRDLTERKKAEKETARLEEQLRQAQKMEAVGTLAGGIAHDFNNILGAVLGYTRIVHDRLEPGSADQEHLAEVLHAAERAKNLVRQILSFSRRSAEKKSPIQMHLVVGETSKLLRQTIPSTIEIKQNIIQENDTVLADPTQLHQVVMNLCINSYHAMVEQGGTLSLTLANVDLSPSETKALPGLSAGPHVVLSVKDTGEGMAGETLARVFEPYFTTKPVGKGTGMGMAVVHGIVQSHDGAISISSALGEGTRVDVYFPSYAGKTTPTRHEEEATRGRGERILVVDDEPALAKMTCIMLVELGYRAEYATSSVEGLRLITNEPHAFDLVVTDQTMPEMAGINLLQNIQAARPGFPVIICTGYSETLTEELAMASGAFALLEKPVEKNRLGETVRRALTEGQGPGFGLVTVNGIVEQHEGCIDLKSGTGVRAGFVNHPPPRGGEAPLEVKAEVVTQPRGGIQRILVCDDDSAVRNFVQIVLRDAGYDVIAAADGFAALEILDRVQSEGVRIDLLLTDALMPGMRGEQLIEEARRRRTGLRAVLMSGYPTEILDSSHRRIRGFSLVSKPFAPAEILAAVCVELDRSG